MHADCILLDSTGSQMLFPPVHSHIATGPQAVVEKSVVGAETRIHLFEISAFNDTVVAEPAE